MDFELSEEQKMIQQTARDFALKEIRPVAAKNEREGIFPAAILNKLAGLGLMGVNVPQEFGGAQAGVVSYALAITEISRECASTAVSMAVTNMVAEAICEFGTAEQKRKHVPRITSGEYSTGAFALTEPGAGSDAVAIRTSAERKGDGYVLRGSKMFITSGSHAGVFIVAAVTEKGIGSRGITAFLVEKGTPGLIIGRKEEKMGLRASDTVALDFDDCEVPASAVLGQVGGGFKVFMNALNGGRIGVGAQALGIGLAALDAAKAYARERVAFGKPIAEHQAIQWMLADSATELEAARLLVLQAAHLKEHKRPFTREESMAKLFASEAANRVCARAVQIHGGYGYIAEYPVERYYRDCRVTTIYEGTSEVQRMVIARELLRD
jgi:alkylation response protein AidB-like acyl-CoA dehydrogenase